MPVWRWRQCVVKPEGAKEREGGRLTCVPVLAFGGCLVLCCCCCSSPVAARRFSGAYSMLEPAAGAAAERRLSNIVMSASSASAAPSQGSKLVTAKKALQQFEGPSTSTHVLLAARMPDNGLDC